MAKDSPRVNKRLAVRIAQDVLLRLRARRRNAIKATKGVYLEYEEDDLYLDGDCPLYKLVGKQKCEACAKGAFLVGLADVRKNNRNGPTIQDSINLTIGGHNVLTDAFTENELHLIESAFEGARFGIFCFNNGNLDKLDEQYELAIKFYLKYPDPQKRLRAIALNIVKNKGWFILGKGTKAVLVS